MKAVVIPAHKQGFRIQEVNEPTVTKGEVKIKVKFGALCYRDYLQIEGYYPRSKYPLILGHEVVGEVEEVGEGVKDLRVGDKVTSLLYVPDDTCNYCKIGEEIYCNSIKGYAQELDGFFAEKAILKANTAIKIPSGVSDEAAVVVPCVVAMVYRGLRRARISKDDVVLVTGAGGGVGIHAIQVAKALGAKVIAVTTSEEKAKEIGKYADHVIIGSKFSEEAKKLGEVSIVIENVGTPTLEESLRSLRTGGKIVQIGNVDPSQVFNLRLGYIILKSIEIIGNVGSTRKDIIDSLKLMAEGKVKPIISAKIPLESFEEGLKMLRSKSNLGKVLLYP
jgi:D-arabinose 1-dehydrogenase-like Zn-dependent alcohol dehydrogenase